MTDKIHRTTSDSKRGRQLMAAQGRIERGPGLTPEQQAWNAEVERGRRERDRRRREGRPFARVAKRLSPGSDTESQSG